MYDRRLDHARRDESPWRLSIEIHESVYNMYVHTFRGNPLSSRPWLTDAPPISRRLDWQRPVHELVEAWTSISRAYRATFASCTCGFVRVPQKQKRCTRFGSTVPDLDKWILQYRDLWSPPDRFGNELERRRKTRNPGETHMKDRKASRDVRGRTTRRK